MDSQIMTDWQLSPTKQDSMGSHYLLYSLDTGQRTYGANGYHSPFSILVKHKTGFLKLNEP